MDKDTEAVRPFTYQEIFDKFPDVANKVYSKDTTTAYRIVHKPATLEDFVPTALQPNDDGVPQVDLNEYDEDAPEEVKKDLVKKYGLSHYNREEKLQVRYVKMVKVAEKKYGKEAAEAIKDRFGTFYVKMNYEKTDGKMSKHGSDGHENVSFYADVDPLQRIDTEFGYKEIKFDEDI